MSSFSLIFGAVVVLLAGVASADTVTLTDNGNGTVTMANAEVTMTFSKADGSVSSVIAAGMPGVNLIDPSQDYALSLTHIGSGTNDYWVSIDSPGLPSYIVVTNTGQIVDVMLDNPVASGSAALWPNGIWDWQEHHVMRAGESGFYTYHVWRHTANMPQSYYTADSWQGRANAFFSSAPNEDGTTSYAWSFSGSDVPIGLSIGGNPPGSTSAGVPGEVVIMPYTNYFTQPTGAYYEPGWPIYTQPCGLTSALYPTWTKYDWSSYEGASNSYRNTWGMATDQVGLWTILGSFEFVNGGPTKLKGAVSGNYMYNDDVEGHGLGADTDNPGVPAGAVWTKMIGPFFMYVNTGTNHMQLWQDATNMGAQMVSNWPYAWVNEMEQVYPRHRGTVTGTIKAKTGESTSNAVVILGDSTYTNWIWQGGTNFLFWTTADSNGNFTIPKVRPDTYVLFCDVPGIWGEIQLSNIVVTADQTNNLGVIDWNPPHLQQRLWRVGTPDHSSKEFRFGDLPKQYGLWWRYLNEMGESNLNFTIGQSVESNDWYYAQPEVWTTPQSGTNLTDHTQTNFTAWSPVWNVIFDLTNLPSTSVLCTVALAGCNGCYFYPYINGVNQTPNIPNFSNPSQGVFTTSGDDIYRDVVEVGRYQYYQFTFPASDFVVGTNTFSIHIRQPGTDPLYSIPNVTNGYPDLLVGGLIYDFLQMEAGPQVVNQNLPAAPTGLVATGESGCEIDLSWLDNATNATSVVVERSTDDVHFTQIGATPASAAAYADTDLPTGTRFYYKVMANNVDGNSAASNIAEASTLAAAPPAAPSGLAAIADATNQIDLTWTNNAADADGFNLERSSNGGNYTLIATLAPSVTNYSDTNLAPATTYFYQVQAFRTCWGSSAFSMPATALTLAPPAPVTPVGLVAVPGNTQISLSWLTSAGASTYNLKRAFVSGGPYNTVASLSGTNYSNTGLVNGTTYYYVVSAVNAGGEGSNSLEAAATPLAFATAYWTNLLTATAQSWNANANWTNIAAFPDAASVVVNMTAGIAAPQTNNLNQDITLGWLNIGDSDASASYMIASNGGALTFANGTNNGAGLVQLPTSAGDTVAAPMIISNNLTVVNNSTSHTLTLSGAISGTNMVAFVGPGSVTLTVSNSYSGGTLLNGGMVICGGSTNTINQYGFGGGGITFNGGTLQFYGFGQSGGTDWGGCSNALNLPAGQSGALLLPPRFGYSIPFTSALTGGGQLNVTVDYIRDFFNGNWSAFTGRIVVSARGASGDFRVNNSFGYANAAIYLNDGVNFYNINANNQTTDIGELGGASGAYLGNGNEQSTGPTWRIGARNTTNTFAGIIEDSGGTSLDKIGAGSLILTGPNTYSGATTISGGILQIGAGGNAGSLGLGNVVDNAALVFNRYDDVILSNIISGSGSLTQAGSGVLALIAANNYSGTTWVTAGTLALTNSASFASSTNVNLANGAVLDVSGHSGASLTLLSGQTLSGDGSANGNIIMAGGSTLAPGNGGPGFLIFSNSLTLSPGSKTILKLSDNLQTNDTISAVATLTCGGTLILTNADTNPLQAGDAFKLLNAATYAGNFSAITLPVAPPGLYCQTNTLTMDGTVRIAVEPSPAIVTANLTAGKLVLAGTGGITNGTYYVLTSTNIGAPLGSWTLLLTNQFDANANFTFTNTLNPSAPQSFYLLQMP